MRALRVVPLGPTMILWYFRGMGKDCSSMSAVVEARVCMCWVTAVRAGEGDEDPS